MKCDGKTDWLCRSPSPAQSPVQPRHMAMLAAGAYPSRAALALGEFPASPLLYRHGAPPLFPGATPAGSLPGVRDLEVKSEPPHLPPPALPHSSLPTDTTGILTFFYFLKHFLTFFFDIFFF